MRRLPVYLVLDVSASMSGEPIEALRNGMKALISALRSDPYALETAFISVILFDSQARQATPLTELMSFQIPDIQAGSATAFGAALTLTRACVAREVRTTTADVRGDWKPIIFIMTDGQPNDDWRGVAADFRQAKIGTVVACAAGPHADIDMLRQVTDDVVRLDTLDNTTIAAFFKWVSASIATSSQRVDANFSEIGSAADLPPPPPQLMFV